MPGWLRRRLQFLQVGPCPAQWLTFRRAPLESDSVGYKPI